MTVRGPAWRIEQAEKVRFLPMTDKKSARQPRLQLHRALFLRVLGDHVARFRHGEGFCAGVAVPARTCATRRGASPTLTPSAPRTRFPKDAA